jgi:hypothetical protein
MFKLIKEHPKSRYSYAITTGVFAGEILIFIHKSDETYDFLSIPKMENRQIPHIKFAEGLKSKIVDIVEKIPKGVLKVCEMQYKKNSQSLK